MIFDRTMFTYENRAVAIGLLAFLLIAVALPIVVALIASFGPSGWWAEYIAPAKQFQPVLFVFVGVIAARSASSSAILNSAIVGFIGGVCLLLFAAALGASPHLSVAAHLFRYVFITVVFCSLGGLGASLFHRYRRAH